MNLLDLFPDTDYRLVMRFQQGDCAAFFGPSPDHDDLLTERAYWLAKDPQRYAVLLEEGIPLLEETIELARDWGTLPEGADEALEACMSPMQRCRVFGRLWEPDFVLMRPDAQGVFRLCVGCVCFPSHWSLQEKVGQTMSTIHSVVPGLNERLESQIDGFLARIKPGISWERANWGLSRSPERNQHPERRLPRLDETVNLDEVWLRAEAQSLVALPETGGVLFGIRIVTRSMDAVARDPQLASRVRRALTTMPEAMARYKNLHRSRARIVDLMG